MEIKVLKMIGTKPQDEFLKVHEMTIWSLNELDKMHDIKSDLN
jgi:hypothetical protein